MSGVRSTSGVRVPVPVSSAAAVGVSVLHEGAHFRRAEVGVQDAGHDDIEGDAASRRHQHGIGVDLKVFVDDALHRHED